MPGWLLRHESPTKLSEHILQQFLTCPTDSGAHPERAIDFVNGFMQLCRFSGFVPPQAHPFTYIIHKPFEDGIPPPEATDPRLPGVTYEYVGCIYIYQLKATEAGTHAVSYVKINDTWYTADNEKGLFLERPHGPPCGCKSRYFSMECARIVSAYYFFSDKALHRADYPRNAHGDACFSQGQPTGKSCLPDSLQNILFFANGFRDVFDFVYTQLQFSEVKATPVSLRRAIEHAKSGLLRYFGAYPALAEPSNAGFLETLASMMVRYHFVKQYPKTTQYVSRTTGETMPIKKHEECAPEGWQGSEWVPQRNTTIPPDIEMRIDQASSSQQRQAAQGGRRRSKVQRKTRRRRSK
jgi:hypothetical protein